MLDTGIDRGHLDFRACDERIKECRSYVGKDRSQVHDSSGHGTHVASLLLDYAPEADIYIAKITEADSVSSSVVASVRQFRHAIASLKRSLPLTESR